MKHNWVFVQLGDEKTRRKKKGITMKYVCTNPGCTKCLRFTVDKGGIPILWRLIKETHRKADAECIRFGCECDGL